MRFLKAYHLTARRQLSLDEETWRTTSPLRISVTSQPPGEMISPNLKEKKKKKEGEKPPDCVREGGGSKGRQRKRRTAMRTPQPPPVPRGAQLCSPQPGPAPRRSLRPGRCVRRGAAHSRAGPAPSRARSPPPGRGRPGTVTDTSPGQPPGRPPANRDRAR